MTTDGPVFRSDLRWGDTASFIDPVTGNMIHFTVEAPVVEAAARRKKGRKLVLLRVVVVNSAPAGKAEFSLGAFELRDADGNRYNAIDMTRGGLGMSVVAGGRLDQFIGWEIPTARTPAVLHVYLMAEGMHEFALTWRG